MSRRRSISTDISTDPKLADVAEEYGPLPLLLYTWAIPHASDFGQITNDPTQFRLLVCPALPVKSSEVACAIQQLVAAGLWRREGNAGREYLQFPEDAWFRHQSYINASKRPNAAKSHAVAEQQQETPRNGKEQQETAQKGVSPSPSPSPSPSLSPERKDPPNPPEAKAQSGSSQAAVLEFAERFRDKHGGEGPHITDKHAKALASLRGDLGAAKYDEALTGFFADAWASENGHSAAVFIGSGMDRWRHTTPPAAKGRSSPVPVGKSALAHAAEREEARLNAILGQRGSGSEQQRLQ